MHQPNCHPHENLHTPKTDLEETKKARFLSMGSSSFSNPSLCESSTSCAAKETTKKKKKGGGGGTVRLSTDPQSVAARQRRHRISDRFKILQSLVPGGSKMDTVSMLEEAIQYVKFLKAQIWLHQTMINLVDMNADDPTLINLPPYNCSSVLDPFYHQQVDLHNSYSGVQVQAEAQIGLPDSWFPGDENYGGFNTSMKIN